MRNGAMAGGFIALSLTLGAAGYRSLAHLPWIDAYLNAAMILTGMGPLAVLTDPAAKLFAIAYSLYSAIAFLTVAAVMLSPVVTRLLHKLHLDLDLDRSSDDHPA